MSSVEAEGRTEQEAIEKALAELGLTEDEVLIDVVREPSKGFLGMGSKPALVKVTPIDGAARDDERRATLEEKKKPFDSSEAAFSDEDYDKIEKRAAEVLEDLMGHMHFEGTVESGRDEEGIALDITSPDSALLIGRKGKNLSSLQYIVNRILSHEMEAHVRVSIDVEGYRDRRKRNLEEMAQRLAEKVRETGSNVRVAPLNPQDRRIVHVVLRNDPDVKTFSQGSGVYRNVIIAPKASGE